MCDYFRLYQEKAHSARDEGARIGFFPRCQTPFYVSEDTEQLLTQNSAWFKTMRPARALC
jgi:hypothetical protein